MNGYAAPQLHTHSVFFNVTETEDGSTRALQPQELYRSQRYATAIYQAELGYRLQQLGYGTETGKNGAPEIQGYSKEYLEASSPRSQQIKDHLEERGLSGAGAAQIAAHRPRDVKVALTSAEMLARHRELAAQFGNQADRIVAEAREHGHKKEPQSQAQSAKRAQESVTYARDKNLEREAVADERDLIRDAVKRASGQAAYREVRANFETRRRSGEFLEIPATKGSAAHRFTTPEMREQEREVIRYLEFGKGDVRPILDQRQAQLIDEKWAHLNESQRTAVKAVLTSSDRVIGIQGVAGAGKTTSLSAIREEAELAGYAVQGFAPTSRATQQLAESGISSTTLQSHLVRSGQPHDGAPSLYFVDEASLAIEREIPFMKGYTVFNVEQVDGLPAHYYAQPANPLPLSERIENADRFMTNTAATILHGGNRAFYSPARDAIQLPPFEAFKNKESFYATTLHELTHWTKHERRLERDFSAKRFGDQGYAREELVAELGAAFLCADLGITPEIRDDHAAYLGHWLNVLKEDKRAIFSAAAHAQRAADYLHGLQQQRDTAAA